MASTVLLSLAAALYLAATIRYQKTLYSNDESDSWSRGRGFVLAAFLVQTLGTISLGIESHRCPVYTLPQNLNMICWAMIGLYLLVSAQWNIEALGAFAAPAATLMMLVVFATLHHTAVAATTDWVLNVHIACIMMGYAAFTLATIVALIYFFQAFLLKRKYVTGFFLKMPSLESLDRVTYRLILLGFVPMVVGISLGIIRAGAQHFYSFEVFLGIATLLIYAAYIHARLLAGWQGRRVNTLLLVGFVFLIATYVGVGILRFGVHH